MTYGCVIRSMACGDCLDLPHDLLDGLLDIPDLFPVLALNGLGFLLAEHLPVL